MIWKVIFLIYLRNLGKVIILEDIPNITGEDFWTRQHYYDFDIPYHFFNLNSLVKRIESLGYILKDELEYNEMYPVNWEYQIKVDESILIPCSSKTLIFKRN